MNKFITAVIIIVLLVILVGYYNLNQPVSYARTKTPITASEPPLQTQTLSRKPIKVKLGQDLFSLIPQYEYRIEGRILSKKRYGASWDARLAPYDLAIGWGPLADEKSNRHIKFDQWGRFYFYKFGSSSYLTIDEIGTNSSNNHIIPGNSNLKKALRKISKNDMVILEGYLVNVEGYHKNRSVSWLTSRSREDKGNGACEIIYLNNLRINNEVFR